MKPHVNINPVANHYTSDDERIIEFFDRRTQKGGLISFFRCDDGTLLVSVFNCDTGVDVRPLAKASRVANLG